MPTSQNNRIANTEKCVAVPTGGDEWIWAIYDAFCGNFPNILTCTSHYWYWVVPISKFPQTSLCCEARKLNVWWFCLVLRQNMTTIHILTILNVNRGMLHVCTQHFTRIYKGIKDTIFYSFVLMMLSSPESEKSIRLVSTEFTVLRLSCIGWLFCFSSGRSTTWEGSNLCFWSLTSQPRSLTLAGSKLSRPLLPNASWSGSWHISFVIMSVFLMSEMWWNDNFPWLSFTSTLLPSILTILKSILYLGMNVLHAWSLTRTRSPTARSVFGDGCVSPTFSLSAWCLASWRFIIWTLVNIGHYFQVED